MTGAFIPAGEFLGPDCPIRTVVVADAPDLPDGKYAFLDSHCTDPTCDCRKTIIHVLHDDQLVSLVNFGWESPEFYQRWMGSSEDPEMAEEMSGVSIDITSPDHVSREGILQLMNLLLKDQSWISMFKEHYRFIKKATKPDNIVPFPKISRNAPCPCGSGKKYKHCCL